MRHLDPDRLTLLALGEPPEAGARDTVTAHLRECAECRAEIESLRATAELARETVEFRDEPAPPPDRLWNRIAAEAGLSAAPRAEDPRATDPRTGIPRAGGARAGDPPRPRPGDARPGDVGGTPADPDPYGPGRFGYDRLDSSRFDRPAPDPETRPASAEPDRAVVVPMRRRDEPARRWVRGVVAVVAAAAVGVVGTLVAVRPWDEGRPATDAGSTAVLGPVDGGPGGVGGRAFVVRGRSGPELQVRADGLPLRQGYYEVWVYDGGTRMVSVGVLGPDSTATLPLPPTLDLRTFNVVDVSEEQYDGNQVHSQVSVLRGTLTG